MVVEVKIYYQRCNNCKKCIEACSFSVLEWFEDQLIVANPNNCPACLECEKHCPVSAIEVREK